MLRHLLDHLPHIVKFRDSHSRVVKKLVELVGGEGELLGAVGDLNGMASFVEGVMDGILRKYPGLDEPHLLSTATRSASI